MANIAKIQYLLSWFPKRLYLRLNQSRMATFLFVFHIKGTRAKRFIGIVKHLNKFLPYKTLIQMYKTFIRP